MALETAFGNLNTQLYTLQEALVSLRTTSREDKPPADDAVLVDLFSDAADDLLGWLEGAQQAASEAHQAVTQPVNLARAWRGLMICQEHYNRVNQHYVTELACYERLAELLRFGRRRGGEWQAWANSVRAALGDCQQPLFDINQALFACWQEVGERVGMRSIVVQANHIDLSPREG
jgi:hypothetical protein